MERTELSRLLCEEKYIRQELIHYNPENNTLKDMYALNKRYVDVIKEYVHEIRECAIIEKDERRADIYFDLLYKSLKWLGEHNDYRSR